MKNLSILAVFLASFLIFFPDIGLADTDWKTYPGMLCQAGHRSVSIDYDAFRGVCNTSKNHNVVVHCPLVRDFSKSKFPILIRHSGRSGNPDVPLRCKLRNMKRTSNNSGGAMEA